MGDELDRLQALGRTDPPPPDALFVERLAGRLEVRRPRRRLPLLLPAAAVAALVLGFVLVLVGHDDTKTLVVDTAADSSVRTGQELQEGDVVSTGAGGSVTVGGETIGPGERAVVRRGRLERKEIPTTITLEALRLRRATALHWTRYGGDDFGRYVVLRQRRVAGANAAQDDLGFLDRRPALRAVRYVVVVLDRQNHAVARSNVLVLK